MAGPAIRCWEMARLLSSRRHQVHLAVPMPSDREGEGFDIVVSTEDTLQNEERWADVIIIQGFVMAKFPVLAQTQKHLVVDLYDPFTVESLETWANHPMEFQIQQHWPLLSALLVQLRIGDFFLCASERQRDFWMGCLVTTNRVNPNTLSQDRLFGKLLDLAPFGISSQPPVHSGEPAAKGVLPGIEPDSRLAIWGGGIWNWFDPISLIKAWPKVMEAVPAARLLFLGMRHPNPTNPDMEMAVKAVALAEKLKLKDKGVVFKTGWVPYERRQDFLLESELGVSMHFHNAETRLSFRTRFLDYIWAGLPCVATEGDTFAEWVATRGTGRVVPYQDPDAIAEAVGMLFADDCARRECAERVRASRAEFTWERALEPLLRYCDDPWFASDIAGQKDPNRSFEGQSGPLQPPPGLLGRVRWYLRVEGPWLLLKRSMRKLGKEARARLRR
jgi:glycosyltransferase involved in cell wall biosynthesis